VYYPDLFGGIPRVIELMSRVRPDLFSQKILVCSDTKGLGDEPDKSIERVKSFGTLMSLPIAPGFPRRLIQRLRDNADICVLHAPFPLADLVLAFRFRRNLPLLVYWHSDIITQERFRWIVGPFIPFIRRTLDRARAIIVSNEAVIYEGSFLERWKNKTIVLPFSVDVEKFSVNPDDELAVEAIRLQYPRLVVACGRLVAYKGFDVLIDAARAINGHIVIIGEGTERGALEAQIKRSGVADRVHLIGSVKDQELAHYFRAASVFALPSVTVAETFGIVQIEAMAAGCAVVNTNLKTAVPGVARHGREGLTVPVGDAQALARAINTLLDDEKLCRSLADAGLERVKTEFNAELFDARVSDLLLSVASSTQTALDPAQNDRV